MGLDLGGLLKGGIHRAGELIEQPFQVTRDIVKDPKHGFDTLKKIPGQNERNDSNMLKSGGIGGWVGKHPQETAAAVVASIFGGAAMLGGGAAAGAGGAGAAGTAGTGASTLGGAGASAYMAPAASGGVAAPATTFPGLLAANSATAASTPAASFASPAAAQAAGAGQGLGSTNFLLNMGNAGVNSAASTGGATSFTPAMLTKEGAAAAAGNSGGLQAASTSALGKTPAASGSGINWMDAAMKMMQSMPKDEQPQRLSSGPSAPGVRGGFSFDRKQYENPLLTKSYNELYFAPSAKVNTQRF